MKSKGITPVIVVLLGVILWIFTCIPAMGGDGDGFLPFGPPNDRPQDQDTQNQRESRVPLVETFTGSLSYSIPIDVPPGRGGVAPNLSLSYNSLQKNGIAGVGCSLDLSFIQRSAKDGVDYDADRYTVFIDGAMVELVKVRDNQYQPTKQGTLYKFTKDGDSWVGTTKEGVRYFYGHGAHAHSKETNPFGTFKWHLDRVEDTSGNTMLISYVGLGAGEPRFPAVISYTGKDGQEGKHEVRFSYESRKDVVPTFVSGSYVTLEKRLRKILVYAGGGLFTKYLLKYTGSTGEYSGYTQRTLLKSVMQYGSDASSSKPATIFTWPQPAGGPHFEGSSIFANIPTSIDTKSLDTLNFPYMVGDVNGDGKSDLVFVYMDNTGASLHVALGNGQGFNFRKKPWGKTITVTDGASGMLGRFQLVDMNGDGKADILYTYTGGSKGGVSREIHVLFSDGEKFNEYEVWTGTTNVLVRYDYWKGDFNNFLIGDVTGDGLPDLVEIQETILSSGGFVGYVYVRKNLGSQFADRLPEYRTVIPDFHFPGYIADVNNDGRGDIVWFYQDRSSNVWRDVRVSLSLGELMDRPVPWGVLAQPLVEGGAPSFDALRFHRMVDMNGDGMADMVSDVRLDKNSGVLSVLLSTGTSFLGPICYAERQFAYAAQGSYESSFNVAELNGDGLPDLWYESLNGKVCVWPSGTYKWPAVAPNPISLCTDQTLTDEVWGMRDTGAYDRSRAMVAADHAGIGIDAIVFPVSLKDDERWELRGLQETMPQHPDLLVSVRSSVGALFDFSYAPSSNTANYYASPSSISNELGPVILQTISSISTHNGVSRSTVRYAFSDGAYDLGEREFRGFGTAIKSYYDGYTEELTYGQSDSDKGLLLENVVRDGKNNIFLVVKNRYEVSPLGEAAGANKVSYPLLTGRNEYVCDGAISNPAKVNECLHSKTLFHYDGYGNVTDRAGYGNVGASGDERYEHMDYAYDAARGIVSLPSSISISKSPDGEVKAQTWFKYYEGTNLLQEKKSWLKGAAPGAYPKLHYTYDGYGNLRSSTDELGNVTTWTYDKQTHSFPHTVTNALGQVSRTEYDTALGKLVKQEDPNGNVTVTTYDALGRLESVSMIPHGKTKVLLTRYVYHKYVIQGGQYIVDDQGKGYPNSAHFVMIEQRDYPNGPEPESWRSAVHIWKKIYLDGLGRRIRTESQGPENKVIVAETIYNSRGWVQSESLPYFSTVLPDQIATTQYKYDILGRRISVVNPDGTSSETGYFQGTVTHTDENGHRRKEDWNVDGRLTQVREYKGNAAACASSSATDCRPYELYATTQYSHDVLGNLTRVSPPQVVKADGSRIKIPQTKVTYDTLSRKTRMEDPDRGTWSYDLYDAHGNLLQQTDALGHTTSYEYDALHRITLKTYFDGTKIQYIYDDPTQKNCVGRLSRVSEWTRKDGAGKPIQSMVTRYSYDEMGRVVELTRTFKETPTALSTTIRTQYDGLGRTRSIATMNASDDVELELTYEYNAGGTLKSVLGPKNIRYAGFSQYTAQGQFGSISFGNGRETAFSYYKNNKRLKSIRTGNAQDLEYGYDKAGNITKITDGIEPQRSQSFHYDDFDRLRKVVRGSNTITYAYDELGNMVSNSKLGNYAYAYNQRPHAVRTVSRQGQSPRAYGYNKNGSMIDHDGEAITYDPEDRPETITTGSGQVVSFAYDFLGRRVTKTSSGATTYYVEDLYERTGNKITYHVFAGGRRVASLTKEGSAAPVATYHHPNHQGSLIAATDHSGKVRQTDFYNPFGETGPGSTNPSRDVTPYKFMGREQDEETGFYTFGTRAYDPVLARFLSPSNWVESFPDSKRLNRYSYAGNNPLGK